MPFASCSRAVVVLLLVACCALKALFISSLIGATRCDDVPPDQAACVVGHPPRGSVP